MNENDLLQHLELDRNQELKNQLLQGKVEGACGAAVVVTNCVANQLVNKRAEVLEQGKLVQLYAHHQEVRLIVIHEKSPKVYLY